MNTVKVRKERLLDKLKENREKHRDDFIKAQIGYRAEVIEQLDRALQDARDNKKITTTFRLPSPSDHTSEYDTAIEMLDWTIGDEIELSQMAFRQYIFDDWDWSQSWLLSNSSYMSKKI